MDSTDVSYVSNNEILEANTGLIFSCFGRDFFLSILELFYVNKFFKMSFRVLNALNMWVRVQRVQRI